MFKEEGTYCINYLWVTGIDNVAFECSFTVPKRERAEEAEKIISSPEIRRDGRKYPIEAIPIHLSETYQANEVYEWVTDMAKTQSKKDFQGMGENPEKIQEVINSGVLSSKKKGPRLAFGVAIRTVLANEVENTGWMMLVDGSWEVSALRYKDVGHLIDPMKLLWSRVKVGERCEMVGAYKKALTY